MSRRLSVIITETDQYRMRNAIPWGLTSRIMRVLLLQTLDLIEIHLETDKKKKKGYTERTKGTEEFGRTGIEVTEGRKGKTRDYISQYGRLLYPDGYDT